MVQTHIGARKRNFRQTKAFLGLGAHIRTPRALERKLRALGWRRIVPGDVPGYEHRNPMMKSCSLPPGYPSVAITTKGPILHNPQGEPRIDDRGRLKCHYYYTLDPEDSPEQFWGRMYA